MAKRIGPWRRDGRAGWYCWHEGRQVRLDADSERAAFAAYNRLRAAPSGVGATVADEGTEIRSLLAGWLSRGNVPQDRGDLEVFLIECGSSLAEYDAATSGRITTADEIDPVRDAILRQAQEALEGKHRVFLEEAIRIAHRLR